MAAQVRANLAAKALVFMAASANMPRLLPCLSVSPLHRVKGPLRQAAKGRSLPLTRLRGWVAWVRVSKPRGRKNRAARCLRKSTAIDIAT